VSDGVEQPLVVIGPVDLDRICSEGGSRQKMIVRTRDDRVGALARGRSHRPRPVAARVLRGRRDDHPGIGDRLMVAAITDSSRGWTTGPSSDSTRKITD